MEADVTFLAKYPFLAEARTYVESLNLTFEDVLAHPIYSAALELGRKRVLDCLGKKYKPAIGDRLSAELSIISYPIARMLAHSIGRAVALRYAEGEADAAYRHLKEEDGQAIRSITQDLGLDVADGVMPALQYTRLSATLARANPKWKLVNRVVYTGEVEVHADEVNILLAQAVMNRVLEPVDANRIPDDIKKAAKNLKTAISGGQPTLEIEYLEMDALPPCVRGMMSALESGIASHQSMFILSTFLANLGLKKQDILGVLAKSPKYDEEKALYQLEFLTGEKGGTTYTCPTCATIKSYGLCKANCHVKHPLQYYRQHARRKPKVKAKPPRKS
jgi:DNA primase large subunit